MTEQPYEQMSDEELEALTEEALRDHEAGRARFQPQGEAALRTEGTVPISIRIPASLLERIKAAAAVKNVPYQRLMKTWLEEGLTRNVPGPVPPPVTVRLTEKEIERLRQSGSLEILLDL